MKIEIYNQENIDTLNWPENQEGEYAKNFLYPLIKSGTKDYIANVEAEVQILRFGEKIFPLVLGNPLAKNSYVCSPYCHYIEYGKDEIDIEFSDQPFLNKFFKIIINIISLLFKKTDLEKVLFVNNWLLSTNLYPDFANDALTEIKEELLKRFPDRTIIFRSINEEFNRENLLFLKKLGFRKVFSRQVYILDPQKSSYRKKKSYQKDLKLAKNTAYQWEVPEKLTEEEIGKLKKFYDLLYIEKYSANNPQFTTKFFRESFEKKIINYHLLKKNGEIFAVIGYFGRNGIITAPIFGYDTKLPKEDGLYRLGTLRMIQEAVEKGQILHKSSGVAKFKMHRGAEPSLEYNLVYHEHLSFRQRIPWLILEKMTSGLIIPIMKRFNL